MVDLVGLLGVVLTQAASAGAARVGLAGADAILAAVREHAATQNIRLDDNDSARLTQALSYSDTPVTWFEHLGGMFRSDRGVLILGPSGAGKTELFARLGGMPPAESTVNVESARVRVGDVVAHVRDTPGDIDHILEHALDDIERGARIFLLVFAFGYLESRGVEPFRRPGVPRTIEPMPRYLDFCRKEETQWLQRILDTNRQPRRPCDRVIVVANKRDLWEEDVLNVERHYHGEMSAGGHVRQLTDQLARRWSNRRHAEYLTLACDYNSMLGKGPSGDWSRERVDDHFRAFRAYLGLLLKSPTATSAGLP